MNATDTLLSFSHEFTNLTTSGPSRPPAYKAVGISLAIASGVFIGISFVLKKVGLLKANVKYNEEAGEGYGYLKNAYWWTGMTLMIIGEICNFVAYAFVDAILVTPLGALSVVITTILSAIFLKERLSFVGKTGCFICIIGSIVIVMNAPAQSSAADIQTMKDYVIAPGFLTYAGVIIIACIFIAFWAGPRYGKKSMMVYLSICSLIGGLSVVATQGLGAAVVAQAGGKPQFNQWFLYVLFVFVVATLVTEIIFLNKALNLFNAALVTPTYYVYFTSSTIVASAILFRGFKGTPIEIATMIMGFLEICAGVVLLQLSKSAKDVPDTAVFTGDLDQVRTVAEQEQPESEPKADAIRGAAGIIRRMSKSRQKLEADEAKRVHDEKMKDQMETIGENEQVVWDGLRRRKTIIGDHPDGLQRRKTLHPPLGMTRFPDMTDEEEHERTHTESSDGSSGFRGSFMNSFRKNRGQSTGTTNQPKSPLGERPPVSPAGISIQPFKGVGDDVNTEYGKHPDSDDAMEMTHVYGLPAGLQRHQMDGSSPLLSPGGTTQHGRPITWAPGIEDHKRSKDSLAAPPHLAHTAKRQFSFQNVFHRNRAESTSSEHEIPRKKLGPRQSSKDHAIPGIKTATEEERLGLVKGDSTHMLPQLPDYQSEDEGSYFGHDRKSPASSSAPALPPSQQPTRESNLRSSVIKPPLDEDTEESGSERDAYAFKEVEERRRDGGPGGGGAFL